VSKLLDPQGNDWDYDRLRGFFNDADAEAIAKIKIPRRHSDDFIAWSLEKTGLFSVRSVYSLALKLRDLCSCSVVRQPAHTRRETGSYGTTFGKAMYPLRSMFSPGSWHEMASLLGVENSLERWKRRTHVFYVALRQKPASTPRWSVHKHTT
jgi:hypothetical protein